MGRQHQYGMRLGLVSKVRALPGSAAMQIKKMKFWFWRGSHSHVVKVQQEAAVASARFYHRPLPINVFKVVLISRHLPLYSLSIDAR